MIHINLFVHVIGKTKRGGQISWINKPAIHETASAASVEKIATDFFHKMES
jgi:hypothetical protein